MSSKRPIFKSRGELLMNLARSREGLSNYNINNDAFRNNLPADRSSTRNVHNNMDGAKTDKPENEVVESIEQPNVDCADFSGNELDVSLLEDLFLPQHNTTSSDYVEFSVPSELGVGGLPTSVGVRHPSTHMSETDDEDDVDDPEWMPDEDAGKDIDFLIRHGNANEQNKQNNETDDSKETKNTDADYSDDNETMLDDDDDDVFVANEAQVATEDSHDIIDIVNTDDPGDVSIAIGESAPDIDVHTEEEVNLNRGRKRARSGHADKSKWEKTINKQMRMHGKRYSSTIRSDEGEYQRRDRDERKIQPYTCGPKCKQKCCSSFAEIDRQNIFDMFWALDWGEKQTFVRSMIDKCPVKERKSKPQAKPRRNATLRYHLKRNNVRMSVCKKLFLATLCIGEKSVYGWLEDQKDTQPEDTGLEDNDIQVDQQQDENNNHHQNIDDSEAPENTDQLHDQIQVKKRRSSTPRPKTKRVIDARSFLEALPKLPSHYCRSTSTKSYLEPVFSDFTELYNSYTDFCKTKDELAVCRRSFKELFEELNLSLFKPKKDQCDVCCGYETKNITEQEYREHIERKESAREEKSKDKSKAASDPQIKVLTLDLQAVLLSPLLKASAMYYKTKLSCHNYTVYDLITKDCTCYFWHEGEGELTANSFASCLHDFISNLLLKSPDTKEVIIYSDGCTYQNRNATLSNMLIKLAVEKDITITQKILEKGHTQMECDSVHSLIERKIRKQPIYTPHNYIDIMKNARSKSPYTVKYLNHTFFQDFSSLKYVTSIRPGRVAGDPHVTHLRVLRYSPNGRIEYKLSFQDDFEQLPKRRTDSIPDENDHLTQLYSSPIPIKSSKYQHLQELKSVIPHDYHSFYDNLKHN